MPSKEAQMINDMFRNMPHDENRTYLDEREEGRNRPKPPLPEGVTLKEMEIGGNYAELIEKAGNEGPLVLYIHGGGFRTGSAQERREITFPIVDRYGSNVIANNYRLSPEYKWPIPLEDCVAFYEGVLEMGYAPENVVLAGESAGASLVLGTILYLQDHNRPLPKAAVVYSGCINHAEHFPSHYDNIATDYMLGDGVVVGDAEKGLFGTGPEGEALARSNYASPYYADLTGFPPTFIAASDTETLFDDSKYLYEKLNEAGVRCEFLVGHDLIHAYPLFGNMPEAVEALDRSFAFIRGLEG